MRPHLAVDGALRRLVGALASAAAASLHRDGVGGPDVDVCEELAELYA
jgi:hypothetical protein